MKKTVDKSDRELMSLYQRGDTSAFEALYARHSKNVFSYLRKRCYSEGDARDIFQNVFIKFHRFRERYDPRYEVIKWVFTIARSELIDFYRKSKREALNFDLIEFSNDSKEVGMAFDLDSEKALTDREREALKLRYFSEQEFTDISHALGISSSNARKVVSRGIKKLRLKYRGAKG